MQNEPNLKNTIINVSSLSKKVCVNFHPSAHRKNEPNTNPIYAQGISGKQTKFMQKNTKKYEKVPVMSLSKYNFSQLFTTFHDSTATALPAGRSRAGFSDTLKNMQNEPNLRETNPICSYYAVAACSSAPLLFYSGQALRKTVCSSFRLPASTANIFRATSHAQKYAKRTQFAGNPNEHKPC